MSGNNRIRVLSYNVRDLKDDPEAVARVVRAVQPDVACLQEVPRHAFAGHRVGSLADACGLLWSGGGARSSGGTAILTSLRVDQRAWQAARLPVAGRFTRSRGYAAAVVGVPGGPMLTVASVHLSLDPAERRRHARLLLDQVTAFGPAPYVIAGDLNEPPGGPAWQAFGEVLVDLALVDPAGVDAAGVDLAAVDPAAVDPVDASASSDGPEPTFPAWAPRRRIDAVLGSSGMAAESLRVPGVTDGVDPTDLIAASDHLPVLADLRILSA